MEKPDLVMMSDPGSLAEKTLNEHFPKLIDDLISWNDFPAETNERLSALRAGLPDETVRPIQDNIPGYWDYWVPAWEGKSWKELPMWWAESYFHRRILEATGYYSQGAGRTVDPLKPKKDLIFTTEQEGFASELGGWILNSGEDGQDRNKLLEEALSRSIKAEGPDNSEEDPTFLVRDNFPFPEKPLERIDFSLNNSGRELAADLLLIDTLLSQGFAEKVILHFKAYPFSPSDATIHDYTQLLFFLLGAEEPLKGFGMKLSHWAGKGKLDFRTHVWWNGPEPLKLPASELQHEFDQTKLLIAKGDLNFRRLVEDRKWAPDTPLTHIVDYFEFPVLALRRIRSEVAAGIPKQQIPAEKDWMSSGRYASLQHIPPGKVLFRL